MIPALRYPLTYQRGDVLQRRTSGQWLDVAPIRCRDHAKLAARAVVAFRHDDGMRFRVQRGHSTIVA